MRVTKDGIRIDKILNRLDLFVLDFLDVFERRSDYVIVSGYVSILLGRSRISEDIDLLFPAMPKDKFITLHKDLLKRGFWSLNSDDVHELYSLLKSRHSIRYGKHRNPFPNMEIKFIKDEIGKIAFEKRMTVHLPQKKISISPLDLQIAYKETALGSDKDKEDALHLRQVFKEHLKEGNMQKYARLIKKHA